MPMKSKLEITVLPGLVSMDDLQQYIIDNGAYSKEDNARIFDKWFKGSPRYLFRAVNRKYNIVSKVMCDVGCAFGTNLIYTAPGSYGIEIDEYPAKFAKSIGLQVERRDIFEDISDLPKVEIIWCSAVLEHVTSPHILLRKLHQLLAPGGMVVLFIPTVPIAPFLRHLPILSKYLTGRLHSDHINAFTPETVRFFCERAGFKTIETSPFYPFPINVFNHIPMVNQLIDGCIYIGEKIDNWEYPTKATRHAANNVQGFE
jgi:SAM-dependent methyltransferase